MGYMSDPEFREMVLGHLCKDRNFLKRVGGLLEEKDFRAKKGGEGQEIQWVAELAIDWWHEYREPIGPMLGVEVQNLIREGRVANVRIGQRQKEELRELVDRIRKGDTGLVAVEALEKRIIDYKTRQAKRDAIQKLLDYQEKGELTDDRFLRVIYEATKRFGQTGKIIDYETTVKKRIARRQREQLRKFPFLFIDPLDREVKTIPRGAVGLLIAKYKRGKSLGLTWIARAMALQGYNVLYFTLEDPQDTVEDRFDACMTGVPLKQLNERSNTFRKRFRRARKLLRGKIKIYDGTEGGMSVARMEEVWERCRNQGFTADVVIIDYDDEIQPPEAYKSDSGRRREFADIYRELRRFASKKDVYLWTAAQTRRGKDDAYIVTGDEIAEDISKVRKVGMCIGIGAAYKPRDPKVGWNENNGRYLYIAAHKWDKQKVGWPIMADMDRAIFYDQEATMKRMAEVRANKGRKRG